MTGHVTTCLVDHVPQRSAPPPTARTTPRTARPARPASRPCHRSCAGTRSAPAAPTAGCPRAAVRRRTRPGPRPRSSAGTARARGPPHRPGRRGRRSRRTPRAASCRTGAGRTCRTSGRSAEPPRSPSPRRRSAGPGRPGRGSRSAAPARPAPSSRRGPSARGRSPGRPGPSRPRTRAPATRRVSRCRQVRSRWYSSVRGRSLATASTRAATYSAIGWSKIPRALVTTVSEAASSGHIRWSTPALAVCTQRGRGPPPGPPDAPRPGEVHTSSTSAAGSRSARCAASVCTIRARPVRRPSRGGGSASRTRTVGGVGVVMQGGSRRLTCASTRAYRCAD